MAPPPDYSKLGIPVAFSDIDKQLHAFFANDGAIARASLMNIVIFSTEAGSLLKNQEIVEQLTAEHACRAILVELNSLANHTESYAWVNAHCRLKNGSKTVCNEQISFWLNGRVRGRIPNSVFAHLDSDLPLVFWWQGELTDAFRPRLYQRINRFIIDSTQWADPLEGYKKITEATRLSHQLIVHDLSWARSYYLRCALALLFEEPLALEALSHVHTVKLSYNPKHLLSVLLLTAWMSDKLGWALIEQTTTGLLFHDKNHTPYHWELSPDFNATGINQLIFLSEQDKTLSLIRNDKLNKIAWTICQQDCHIERLLPCDSLNTYDLVASQLARGGMNSVYNNYIPFFSSFLASTRQFHE